MCCPFLASLKAYQLSRKCHRSYNCTDAYYRVGCTQSNHPITVVAVEDDFSGAPAPALAPAPYALCSGPGKWNPNAQCKWNPDDNWFHHSVLLLSPGPDTQGPAKLGFSFSPHVLFANHPTQIREFEIVVPTEFSVASGYNGVLDMTCSQEDWFGGHYERDSATFSTLAMSTDQNVLRITFRPTSNPWLLATADGFAPQCVIQFDRLTWWISGGSYIMTTKELVTRSNRAIANTVMQTSTCAQATCGWGPYTLLPIVTYWPGTTIGVVTGFNDDVHVSRTGTPGVHIFQVMQRTCYCKQDLNTPRL